MNDRVAEIKQKKNKKAVIASYKLYVDNPEDNESQFYSMVTEFAKIKLYYLELEFSNVGTAGTADDYAQEVAISVWSNLAKFKGTPTQFYSWLHRICFNKAAEFFNELHDQKTYKIGVTMTAVGDLFPGMVEGGQYEETIDHPVLHEGQYNDSYPTIPASVQGIDRHICKLLLNPVQVDGNGDELPPSRKRSTVDYVSIGKSLSMTEDAVKQRIKRLKKRLTQEREDERAYHARIRAEYEALRKGKGPQPKL